MSVKAETTSDLYKLFGLEDTTAFTAQQSDYMRIRADYDSAVEKYNYVTEFNAVIDALDINTLKRKRKEKKKELEELSEKIRNEGFFLEYEELQKLYSKYSESESEYSSLNYKYSKYKNKKKLDAPTYDFDEMSKVIADADASYKKMKKESTIGELYAISNFMENTICIKREFDGTMTMFRAVQDTGVLALFNGHVLASLNTPDYGEVITIGCNDHIEVTYYGVRARYVQEDDVVRQYQKIATTNDGLYISLKIGDNYYDISKLYEDALNLTD